jgi:hypothetical protein
MCTQRSGTRFVLRNLLAGMLALANLVPALAASPGDGPSVYQSTRYLDDFSFLGDPARASDPSRPADFWDGMKYIRLGDDPYGQGTLWLSFGGELRERFEAYTNPNFGINAPAHNNYLQQRLLLHADLNANDYIRGFLQLGSMQRLEARGIPSTTDINQLDIMQGFVDIRVPTPLGDALTLRTGRQEVLLGFQRLVAVREGPNVRRSFEGFRLSDSWGGATIDLLALRPVTNKSGAFNDSTNMLQALWGAYATVPLLPGLSADLYWLGYDHARATFRGKIGGEQRQSFGTRVFGAMAGWDWNEEAVLQVGSFRGQDIRAWMVASIVGYTFRDVLWEPRIALEGNASSGDNPRSATIGT